MIPYWTRLKYAFSAFFALIDFGKIPDDILAATGQGTAAPSAPAPQPPVAKPETADRAVQMLAILQRDGRLVDFLMEDLTAYQDAQVGAAVRDVHAGCRAALARYATLAPVIDDQEGHAVTVEPGTDPAAVKVTGNITGEPPYRGVLRHRGWQAMRLELPPLPASGRTIIAPAEVEVS
ncbi:MAG TPA: DUF2760 domain-containing protein [Vicinamibacterales bacterium]